MNKGIIVAVVIGLLLVLGAGGYYYFNFYKASNITEGVIMEDLGVDDAVSEMKSLKDLMGMSASQQCSFSDPETQTSGTAYISDQQVRTDISATVEGNEVLTHAIVKGDTVYVWTEGQTEGYSMSATKDRSDEETMMEDEESNEAETVDLDRLVDYRCNNWNADESMFSLPAGVDFTDFGAMMEDVSKMMEEEFNLDCSACDSLSGEAADACLKTLGC